MGISRTVYPGRTLSGTFACVAESGGQWRRLSKWTYCRNKWVPVFKTISGEGAQTIVRPFFMSRGVN